MNRDQIIRIQRAINDAGFGPVVVDGIYGPRTETAYSELLRNSDTGGMGNTLPVPPASIPWWTSRAQVGWLLTIVLALASRALGMELEADAWTPVILDTLSGITALFALWGNVKRSAPIDQSLVAPGICLPAGRMRGESVPTHDDETSERIRDFWAGDNGPFIDR